MPYNNENRTYGLRRTEIVIKCVFVPLYEKKGPFLVFWGIFEATIMESNNSRAKSEYIF